MSAAMDAVTVLASAGVDAAKVAVLVVMGAMVAFVAAVFGTVKVLELLGFSVPGFSPVRIGTLSSNESRDAEYDFMMGETKRESRADGWSNASGTRAADFDRWAN